ncbi:MAG: hypothetical protein KJ749_14695 [Planctomycetes bacterium]|nr:hypothetical protein [Planctomycetota bacterium]
MSDLLKNTDTLWRAVFSGVVALVVLALIHQEPRSTPAPPDTWTITSDASDPSTNTSDAAKPPTCPEWVRETLANPADSWQFLLVLAPVVGSLIYAVHLSVYFPFVGFPMFWINLLILALPKKRGRNAKHLSFGDQTPRSVSLAVQGSMGSLRKERPGKSAVSLSWRAARESKRCNDLQRWLRRSAGKQSLQAPQMMLDRWAAVLHLLYGSGVAMLLAYFVERYVFKGAPESWPWLTGIGLYILAAINDCRAIRVGILVCRDTQYIEESMRPWRFEI